jgi:NDP-sugar pyrophosphorylase family protein
MKAFLIATKELSDVDILSSRLPAVLLPLLDRPFIQHVVEYLTDQGINEFEIVVCHFSEKIKEFLGNGERWGINITYHHVKNSAESYKPLQALKGSKSDVLIGNADRLPVLNLKNEDDKKNEIKTTLFSSLETQHPQDDESCEWSGWARLSKSFLGQVNEFDEKSIYESLNQGQGQTVRTQYVEQMLSVATLSDLLSSQEKAMTKKFHGLHSLGKQVEPGVWLSRNVELQPDVKILPPVYIAEDSRLIKGCQIGPNTVIGNNCIVDKDSVVKTSVVLPGTYIGEDLELSNALADKNLLINIKIGSEIQVTDDFLIGSITDFSINIKRFLKYFSVLSRIGRKIKSIRFKF